MCDSHSFKTRLKNLGIWLGLMGMTGIGIYAGLWIFIMVVTHEQMDWVTWK